MQLKKVNEMETIFSGKRSFALSVIAVLLASAFGTPVLPGDLENLLPGPSVAWAAPEGGESVLRDLLPGRNDPGVQLNQTREYLERQRIAQQIAEDEAKRKAQVETDSQKPEEASTQVSFTLTRVKTDPSEILTEKEIQGVTDPYIGKTVSLQDLYDITGALNKLYAEKGYVICRAYLPPQRIHEGQVQIKFMEGKTGKVTVQGLRFTRESYVTRRVPLQAGQVANTDKLNRDLQRFNATNDVQLRIMVHAGEQPGTTDYEIVAFEPEKNHVFTLYTDNHGYDNSGRWREGAFYTMRSLTGQRDALRLNYLRSKGTDVFGSSYTLPLNHKGTVLDIDYGTNTTEVIKGNLSRIGVKGHAYAASLTLRHPLRVDQKRRDEIGIQYLHQKSQTDLNTKSGDYIKWVNDVRNAYIPYISFTHYGTSSVFYHKHSLAFTNYNGNLQTNYGAYKLDALYQKQYGGGQMLSARLVGQIANENKVMSSSDRFYIGGSNTVRGYEESYLGGNQGYAASIAYQVPLNKKRSLQAFTFFDYGRVYGYTVAGSDHTLTSTGLGLSASYKNLYASMTLGIPLKRDFDYQGEKPGKTRIDFNCSYTF